MHLLSIFQGFYQRSFGQFNISQSNWFLGNFFTNRTAKRLFYYLDEIFTDLKAKGINIVKRYAI
jgi:hypothetical protein